MWALAIADAERLGGGKLRDYCLEKLLIRSLIPSTLARDTVKGWIVQCKLLDL
jgi:hypothetical protein